MHIALIIDETSLEKEIGNKSLVLFEESLKELQYTYEIIKRPSMRDKFLGFYKDFNVAIPVIHGGYGEGGQITALLELLELPFIFSDHDVHAVCFDKYISNLIVQDIGYHIPKTFHIQHIADTKDIPFPGPYFVKPNTSGSSLDCGKYVSIDAAEADIQKILGYDSVCVQESIKGREFTVSLTGEAQSPHILGIMEILTEKEFFDYDAKYKREKTQEIFPDLPHDFQKEIEETSIAIYKKFRLRDVARIDYLYADNILYFLEVNTIPGMTSKSFFPQCVQNSKYQTFALFLKDLLEKKKTS